MGGQRDQRNPGSRAVAGTGTFQAVVGPGPGVSSIGFLGAGEWISVTAGSGPGSVLEVAEEQQCPRGWVGSRGRVRDEKLW